MATRKYASTAKQTVDSEPEPNKAADEAAFAIMVNISLINESKFRAIWICGSYLFSGYSLVKGILFLDINHLRRNHIEYSYIRNTYI